MRLDSFLPWRRRKKEEVAHDQTVSSVYPKSIGHLKHVPNTNMRFLGLKVFQDIHGRLFYNITKNPKDQMFLARLVKGVMSVSDVLYDPDSGKYYSYEIPLDTVEPQGENKDEYADTLIMRYVFNDADHMGIHNIATSKDGKRHAFYDFEMFIHFWSNGDFIQTDDLSFLAHRTKEEYGATKERLISLKNHLSGEGGRNFMTGILNDLRTLPGDLPEVFRRQRVSGVEIQPTVEMFQDEVLRRIDAMLGHLAYEPNDKNIKNT